MAAAVDGIADCGWLGGLGQGHRIGGVGKLGQTGPARAAVMICVGDTASVRAASVLDWAERDFQGWQQQVMGDAAVSSYQLPAAAAVACG